MQEYIEIFRVEAKSLLKSFRNNETTAVARCKKVFGNKTDLSLMNIQHIIAKEYGFVDWNALTHASSWQLSEALIENKNKEFTTPFSVWTGKRRFDKICYAVVEDMFSFIPGTKKILAPKKGGRPLNLCYCDVSKFDFSEVEISECIYNNETVWPTEKNKLPLGEPPLLFLEKHKNPGLGVRLLHKQGINGKGRAVAIISSTALADHLEYHYNIKDYETLSQEYNHVTGGWNTSVIVGKSCGVAPQAELYYIKTSSHDDVEGAVLVDYANALEKLCKTHEKLLYEGKNGIDAICISDVVWCMMKTDKGFALMQKAVSRAKELGIFIVSPALGADYGLSDGGVFCTNQSNPDNPVDYEGRFPVENIRQTLCFPCKNMTVAEFRKIEDYCFVTSPVLRQAWEAGLYVLAKGVKSDLTPEEFWNIGLKTGDLFDGIGTIVNPQRLLEALKG